MARTVPINTRTDAETKMKAQRIFRDLHLSMSQAINLFLQQVTLHRGLPFEVKLPNDVTLKAMADVAAGEDTETFETADELFEDLDR